MDSISSFPPPFFWPLALCSSFLLVFDFSHLFCCWFQRVAHGGFVLAVLVCSDGILGFPGTLSFFLSPVLSEPIPATATAVVAESARTDGKKGNLIAKQINRCKLCPRRSTSALALPAPEFSSSRLCTTSCLFFFIFSSAGCTSALSYLAASLLNYHQIEIESDFAGAARAGGTLSRFLVPLLPSFPLVSEIWSYGKAVCLSVSLPACTSFLCTLLDSKDLLSQLSGQKG